MRLDDPYLSGLVMWLSGHSSYTVCTCSLNGQISDPLPVLSGVPHDLVLGQVLFLFCINDLSDNVRSSNTAYILSRDGMFECLEKKCLRRACRGCMESRGNRYKY